MTLRLVGLMCVVLLLSLTAFGLAMSYYQEQVMAEVARTASDVGRAAFTFDFAGPGGLVRRSISWKGERNPDVGPFPDANTWVDAHQNLRRVFVAGGSEDERNVFHEIAGLGELARVEGCEPGGASQTRRLERTYGDGTAQVTVTQQDSGDCDAGFGASVFINVKEIRAEADARGMALVIPTLRQTSEPEAEPRSLEMHVAADATASEDLFLAPQDEIHLPIDLDQFTETFNRIRGRSLLLFLGVFVVGTALSTGVATRFTRPIRRLDAGIRRLSEGDLSVQVEVERKDEIGRLSRAFNEMAGRLQANRERAREMVRREKLSALGRLAAGVAHDVRNPLHSIGLTLQHLNEAARPESEEKAAEFERSLDIIRGEIRRLDRLVGNFLSFAKSERLERERVHLGELLRETTRLVQKEAERRNIDLELEVDEATPPVPVDAESVRSSVLNLVLNSFEAMPDGGRLTLRLTHHDGQARLEVRDTGHGIPEDEQEHVFEFAYTTRDGGNGLGLAMVHHCIVEEHGGSVDLESSPGEGTRIVMELPVTPDLPSEPQA